MSFMDKIARKSTMGDFVEAMSTTDVGSRCDNLALDISDSQISETGFAASVLVDISA